MNVAGELDPSRLLRHLNDGRRHSYARSPSSCSRATTLRPFRTSVTIPPKTFPSYCAGQRRLGRGSGAHGAAQSSSSGSTPGSDLRHIEYFLGAFAGLRPLLIEGKPAFIIYCLE